MTGDNYRVDFGHARVDECDFDLHGIVGVRLVDATVDDVATVRRQLGPLQRPLERDPDIIVRFVDRIETVDLRYAAIGTTAWDHNGFYVMRSSGATSAKARISFADVGRQPEIVCERAMPMVPHLLAIINVTALTKGVLPLHASAFTLNGAGVLVTGWAKGGKTESLLACMQQGATYVGDEWIYLTSDGRMFGIPEPIRLWSWQLQQLPSIRLARSRRQRLRLTGWHGAAAATGKLAAGKLGNGSLRKVAPVVARQAYVQVPPFDLFGAGAVSLQGQLDATVLVVNQEAQHMRVSSVTGDEVAQRMRASLEAERAPLAEQYLQFLFAFPGAVSEAIETASSVERRLLSKLFDGQAAAEVAHPYPCDIAALGRAVMDAASLCGSAAAPHAGEREIEIPSGRRPL